MTTTTVSKDLAALTMTITTELGASPERAWQLWADPRQLERWWGPPTHPATVTSHELASGGRVEYHMTGPEGDRHYGYWEVIEVEAPSHLVFRDGFATEDGTPNEQLPTTTTRVTIEGTGEGRSRMSIASEFESAESMEQLLAMGMEEGMAQALGQIEGILTGDTIS